MPLFAGGDLEPEGLKEVSVHLSECEACSLLLAEYSESQNWLRSQTQPEFDDAFYTGLQQNVMREIARSQPRPSFFHQLIAGLRLNPRWAMAFVMLVLAGAFAFYFYSSRTDQQPDPKYIVKIPEPQEKRENPAPKQDVKRNDLVKLDKGKNRRPHSTPQRNLKLELPPVKQELEKEFVAQDWFDKEFWKTPTNTSEIGEAKSLDEMTRMDIQTGDPNIRIIWFAPKVNPSPSIKVDTE
jgi:hypothetical protein